MIDTDLFQLPTALSGLMEFQLGVELLRSPCRVSLNRKALEGQGQLVAAIQVQQVQGSFRGQIALQSRSPQNSP